MCLRKHWEKYDTSPAYHAAKRLSLELEELAKVAGYKRSIIVKKKHTIIKEGFGKADAQVIWEDGPEDWAISFYIENTALDVDCVAENSFTLSFYDK
jgi:hypothetical protein